MSEEAGGATTNAPSQTIYVNNLDDTLANDVTRKSLYMIFSEFGKVLEVKASKANKLRGQAWIVFQDVTAATNAIRRRQGFNFYGKPLKIDYAKQKSDIVARKDGSFVQRPKKVKEEKKVVEKRKRDPAEETGGAAGAALAPPVPKAPKLVVNNVPHRILFAQQLPSDITQETLVNLFAAYPGFQEVRMVPGKREIAFVEFSETVQAGIALQQLGGFKLNETNQLHLTYGNQ